MQNVKEYSIRELSDMFQLPLSTIRYYEETGILSNIARSKSGQRIFTEIHVNRLKTICCFKNAGMTISELQTLFSYEANELEHLEDILLLLQHKEEDLCKQIQQLEKARTHLRRKSHYYSDIKSCAENNLPLPQWAEYKHKYY